MRSFYTDRLRQFFKIVVPPFLLLAYASGSLGALGGFPIQPHPNGATVASSIPSGTATYSVRDTTLPTGTQVREYVSNSGIVFGVTWNGPVLPNLKELLGKHFDTMVAESAKRPKAGRSRLHVDLPGVVIDSGGHMRAFEGSAWVPAQFPPGFSFNEAR